MPKKSGEKLTTEEIEELGAAYVVQCVADKWKLHVIRSLARHGPLRFGELHRDIGPVSQKVFTQTLRKMEHDGLVHRQVFAEVPPKVIYSMTPLGQSLHEALMVLCKWAQDNLSELQAAEIRARGGHAKQLG